MQSGTCRTCNFDHRPAHKTGKKEMTKEEAFQKVLASVTGQLGGSAPGSPKKKRSK